MLQFLSRNERTALLIVFIVTLLIVFQRQDYQNSQSQHDLVFGTPRSPHWHAVQHQTVKEHPYCAACGSTEDLNVHHKLPFHVRPDLEVTPSNLIVLCRVHHFDLGHLRNWNKWNPNVQQDADEMYYHLHRKHPPDWEKRNNPFKK